MPAPALSGDPVGLLLALTYTRPKITDTTVLHKPVDYALAGDQAPTRQMRIGSPALRHAFDE